MKQICNGFQDYYYLTKEGKVYNAKTNKYLTQNEHKYTLKTIDNKYKRITLKRLYWLVYNANYCEDSIKDLEGEEWKAIPNTQGLYMCSNKGRIKSLTYYKACLMKYCINRSGYYRVDIVVNKRRSTKFVHRIVAECWLPKPKHEDMQIHHINSDRLDNRSDNLMWCTQQEHRKLHELIRQQKEKEDVSTKPKDNIHKEDK